MFDDFCPSQTDQQSRKRFGGSMAVAVLIYGTSSAAIVAATATARHVVEEKETQIEFAPPPEPEPPPPPPVQHAAAPPSARPKVKRPELAPPVEISKEKLAESNKALAEAGPGGPADGFLNGVEGGKGTGRAPPPPPVKEEPLVPPVPVGSHEKPKYSASAKRKGIEGSVVVAFEVLENGSVANVRILSGPPELHDTVLRGASAWRYRPAHRGNKFLRYSLKVTVTYRLEDT